MAKESPILFSTPMVQAILDGRKTKTRRIIKPQPQKVTPGFSPVPIHEGDYAWPNGKSFRSTTVSCKPNGPDGWVERNTPCGKPGDLLWVRETWAPVEHPELKYRFMADHKNPKSVSWKPSIHMPKEAARIWLEVESVRVERLQDILWNDATAEGIEMNPCLSEGFDVAVQGWKNYQDGGWFVTGNGHQSPQVQSFQSLWHSINGPESWDQNPWVWVIQFKVISKTGKP